MNLKKTRERFGGLAERMTKVPHEDTKAFEKAVTEHVVKPMKDRALTQREAVARARARSVR